MIRKTKFLIIVITLSLLSFSLVSCSLGLFSETYTVNIVYENREISLLLSEGSKIPAKYEPEKSGFWFNGWYTDEECRYPFSGTVNSDVTLYADFEPDMSVLANNAAEELLPAVVKIRNKSYNTSSFGNTTEYQISTGSGVIFMHANDKYYLLTNSHVVDKSDKYDKKNLVVIDCYGNEHSASLEASDSTYDLAVLTFSSNEELGVAQMDNPTLIKGDILISIGSPNGVLNSVTFGEYLCEKKVQKDDNDMLQSSDINFAVGWHTAPIDHGSSGGGVFDENLNLVGINYATGYGNSGEYFCGLFVPIEKVVEFIELKLFI